MTQSIPLNGQFPLSIQFKRSGGLPFWFTNHDRAPADPYWAQYFTLFDSATDVITLLDTHSLNSTLDRHPHNIATLIHAAFNHLASLLATPTFPRSATGADLSREALNALRVLARVVPFVFSQAHLEEEVFWATERVKVEKEARAGDEGGQFVLEDEDEEEEGAGGGAGGQAEEEYVESTPLAHQLLHLLVDLAFVPGFTLADECRSPTASTPISHVIWEPGIASAPSSLPPTPPVLLSNRLELLRLLSLLLALPALLTPAPAFPSTPNRWRAALVQPGRTLERKVALCFLCSLLNQAFAGGRPVQASESGGLGLGGLALGAAGRLSEVVLRREDVRGLVTGACLQLLGVLLIEHAPIGLGGEPEPNAFEAALAKLHRTTDFDFILNGTFAVLNQVLNPPLLPAVVGAGTGAAAGKPGWATEALVVLWRALDGNSKLAKYTAESERGADLVVALLSLCLEFKDDETQLGLVRLCAYMLQTFTAQPGLAIAVNAPVEIKAAGARAKFNVPGTLGDFLIVSIYTLIFSTKAKLASLYPPFVLAITNLSPHLKALGPVASTKLVQIFLATSAPGFLLMEEGNPRLVFYLLEAFNNVIYFQLSDNPHLIYAIIRSSQRFESLSTFTLAAGVAEVRRVRAARKAGQTGSAGATPTSSARPSISSPRVSRTGVPLTASPAAEEVEEAEKEVGEGGAGVGGAGGAGEVSEKARGKMRARSRSGSGVGVQGLPPVVERALEGAVDEVGEGERFVGKNGFVPTEGWVASWREG